MHQEEHDQFCPTNWNMECQCYLIKRVRKDMQDRMKELRTEVEKRSDMVNRDEVVALIDEVMQ